MIKIHNAQQSTNYFYKPKIKTSSDNNHVNDRAVTVTISDESKNKFYQSLKFRETNKDDVLGKQFQKFYEDYNSAEAIEKRLLEQLEKEQAYNRLEDEFSLNVKYDFPENTLQHTIKEALEGKVANSSLYAAELASALRSSISMPSKSVEERAAYREMALKQAEYIANNYFTDEQEATSFMNEIRKYYENDVLREKGYIVIDNSNLEPFKNYSSPITKNNNVSFYTLAKKYMDEDYFERFINGEGNPMESAKFLMQLQNKKEKYNKEIIEEFELNEQQVEEQIAATKKMLDSFSWENGIISGTMEEDLPNYLHEILKWNQNMLNLFK